MFVNTEQIQMGAMNFVENELGKNATGFNKFMVYFSMPIIKKKIAQSVNQFAENELTKDLFDDNHNVDIDTVYNMGKEAIRKSGQFVAYGVIFTENDIDKLYNYIRG